MIRTILIIAFLVLLPLSLFAGGIHGLITGEFTYRHGHITGLTARVISSWGVIAGAAVLRTYWLIFRKEGFDSTDPILRTCLVIGLAALASGLALMFLTVAF